MLSLKTQVIYWKIKYKKQMLKYKERMFEETNV